MSFTDERLERAREAIRRQIELEGQSLLYDIKQVVEAWGGVPIVQRQGEAAVTSGVKELRHQPSQGAPDEWLARLRAQGFGEDWVQGRG